MFQVFLSNNNNFQRDLFDPNRYFPLGSDLGLMELEGNFILLRAREMEPPNRMQFSVCTEDIHLSFSLFHSSPLSLPLSLCVCV